MLKEIKGNLFDQKAEAICITTNGFITTHGTAVLGRGVALGARALWPEIDAILGVKLKFYGNHVYLLTETSDNLLGPHKLPYALFNFPVKPDFIKVNKDMSNLVPHMRKYAFPGKTMPGYAAKADMAIIKRSCSELMTLVSEKGYSDVILPRPGCGAGGLNWDTVKKEISDLLGPEIRIINK